jgi:DNA-binding MarR family transcriptional regulator
VGPFIKWFGQRAPVDASLRTQPRSARFAPYRPTPPSRVADIPLPDLSRPADPRFLAWRRFLQAHAVVTRKLEAELVAEQDLSLADFDVLIQLSAADGWSLRMSELADRVVLSRSGMTRRIDRLQAAGLVRRESCPDDRRGALAVLTPAGAERLAAAMPVHFRGVEEHFLARLDHHDLDLLRRTLRKVTGAERLAAAEVEAEEPVPA